MAKVLYILIAITVSLQFHKVMIMEKWEDTFTAKPVVTIKTVSFGRIMIITVTGIIRKQEKMKNLMIWMICIGEPMMNLRIDFYYGFYHITKPDLRCKSDCFLILFILFKYDEFAEKVVEDHHDHRKHELCDELARNLKAEDRKRKAIKTQLINEEP